MQAGGGVAHLGEEPVAPPSRHDDDLIPAIDRLARRLCVTPAAIERIAVSVGPGGFTAVRVAVATGKLLAEATTARGGTCRCIAIPSALVAGWNVEPAAGSKGIAVALASKGDTVHLTTMPSGWRESPAGVAAGTVVTAAALASFGSIRIETLVGDQHLPEAFLRAASEAGLRLIAPHFSARACLELAAHLPAIGPLDLLPLYPREPEAVTLWKQRKSK